VRLAVNGSALSAATRLNVSATAVMRQAGASLCAAMAAAMQRLARFPSALAGGVSPSAVVACVGFRAVGELQPTPAAAATATPIALASATQGRRRALQATAPPTTAPVAALAPACDPLAPAASAAAGCTLVGFDLDLGVSDEAPGDANPSATADTAAAVTPAAAPLPGDSYAAAIAAALQDTAAVKAAMRTALQAASASGAGVGDASGGAAASLLAVSTEVLAASSVSAAPATAPAAAAAAVATPSPSRTPFSARPVASGPSIGVAVAGVVAAGVLAAVMAVGVNRALAARRRRKGSAMRAASLTGARRRGSAFGMLAPPGGPQGGINPFSRSSKLARPGGGAKPPGAGSTYGVAPQPVGSSPSMSGGYAAAGVNPLRAAAVAARVGAAAAATAAGNAGNGTAGAGGARNPLAPSAGLPASRASDASPPPMALTPPAAAAAADGAALGGSSRGSIALASRAEVQGSVQRRARVTGMFARQSVAPAGLALLSEDACD
jgi:hypothetical protein